MKSSRIIATKTPLEIADIPEPVPTGDQVLLSVRSAGVCHSDLHLCDGGYAGPPGVFMKVEDRGVKFPLTPGHEIAGVIEAIGDTVTGFKPGDPVLVFPWIGEGDCTACRSGEENVCHAPRTLGIYRDGGYSEKVLVPSFRHLVPLDDSIDMDAAASLACSGLTAYTAVKKASLVGGETLVITGAGGLGLMGIQIARALADVRIIAIDIDDTKLHEARRLGADIVINASNQNALETVRSHTDNLGAHAVIDFVNSSATAPAGFDMLRKKGRLVLVGLFGGHFDLNLPLIAMRAITITGAYTGNYADLVALVNLARQGKIQSVVTRRFTLGQANQALEELAAGKILGRAVINP